MTAAAEQAFFCKHVPAPEEWADIAEPEFEGIIEDGRLAVPYPETQSGAAQVIIWLVVRVVSESDTPTNHQLVVYFEVEGTGALSHPISTDFTLSRGRRGLPLVAELPFAVPGISLGGRSDERDCPHIPGRCRAEERSSLDRNSPSHLVS